MQTTLGEILRSKRKQLGVTQEHIATQIGVSHVAIHKWETNQSIPTDDKLEALATALDLDFHDLKRISEITDVAQAEERKGIRLSACAQKRYPFLLKLIICANEEDDLAVKYSAQYCAEVASKGVERPRIDDEFDR